MARATQFSVALENKPGTLDKLAKVLKKAKVNIEAISVADTVDTGLVRLVAKPAAKAKKALSRAKFSVMTQSVLVVKAPNEPGELASMTAKLAKAKVNINYVYGTAAGAGSSCTMVLSVNNLAAAERALR